MPTNYVVPTSTSFRLAGLDPAINPADLGLEFMGETAHLVFKAAAIQPYKRTRPYQNFNTNFGVNVPQVAGQNAASGALASLLSLFTFASPVLLPILGSWSSANWKRAAEWLAAKILALQASAGGPVSAVKVAILKQFL